MRILDRYILRSIIAVFVTTLVIFSLLYILIDSASNLDEYLNQKASFAVIIQYYLSYLPVIVVQTSSIACLISVLFAFTHFNSNNEVIALRASGLNFWQITRPAIIFTVLVSACIFLISERYLPQAETQTEKIRNERIKTAEEQKQKKLTPIKNLTFYGLKSRLYFIDAFNPNTYELDGITIIEYDNNQNIREKTVALSGKWTGIAWKFFKCHITSFPESVTSATEVRVYEEKLMDIKETPPDFLKQRLNVQSMNIKQLHDYISRFANSGAVRALNNLRVDLYQKIAVPFGNIVIILVGLPIALMTGRRKAQTFTALGVAVGIGFFYYVCNAVGLALGKGGVLSPFLAAWLAPVVFAGMAWYLIRTKF